MKRETIQYTKKVGCVFSILKIGIRNENSGFLGSSVMESLPANAGDAGARVRSLGGEDSPRGGHGNPLQHSCLETPHGQKSLAGYCPWGPGESDTTQRLKTAPHKSQGPSPPLYLILSLQAPNILFWINPLCESL